MFPKWASCVSNRKLASAWETFLKIWRCTIRHLYIFAWTHLLFPLEIDFVLANQKDWLFPRQQNVFWSSSKQMTSSPERASQCDGLILHRHVLENRQQAGEELSSTCWIFLQLEGLWTHELSVCASAVAVRSCGASLLSHVHTEVNVTPDCREDGRPSG